MSDAVVHLSSVAGSPLLDSSGAKLGRVQDVVVRLDGRDTLPLVSGLKARIGGREMFVPADRIDRLEVAAARTSTTKLNLAQFERRPGEVLLRADVLGHSLINVDTARLMVAREVELSCSDGVWRVAGIDPSFGASLRRLLPRRFRGRRVGDTELVEWTHLEPFVGHVPSSRLRLTHRRLSRLHAAQIADLVEAASHEEGEEIIEAVGLNRQLEADVFEELDPDHQREFLNSRSDAEAARLLATMAPDDAADLIVDLDQERRIPILEALPDPERRKIRALLSYHPETAGGLMSPDFVTVPETDSVGDAHGAVRRSTAPDEAVSVIFVTDHDGQLVGTASLVSLLRSSPDARVSSVMRPDPPNVHADWDLTGILRKMSDYNLTVAPVLDADHRRVLGVVTVDDLLELLLPSGWRRDYGPAAAEG
jgi:CBS domain-containing protein/sporulation protein YlmC with PRC-barrel domain